MVSKYDVVYSNLKKKIIDKEYNDIGKLPTEEELVEIYNVSKNTIRKAIDKLVNNGFVYKVQGSGVFLRNIVNNNFFDVENMNGLFMNIQHYETTVKVLKFEVISADEFLSNKLKCDIGTEIYHVIRMREYNNIPFDIEESFFNKEIVFYLNEEICKGSIFRYINEDLKLNNRFANREIYCSQLNAEDASLLKLTEGEPCINVENITFLSNGKIFDYSTDKFNYKLARFFNASTY